MVRPFPFPLPPIPLPPHYIFKPGLANATPVKTFDDYDKFLHPKGVKPGHIYDKMIPPNEIREKLDQIKGHLVWMPLEFLKDAPMAETGLQVNSWTESIYT